MTVGQILAVWLGVGLVAMAALITVDRDAKNLPLGICVFAVVGGAVLGPLVFLFAWSTRKDR